MENTLRAASILAYRRRGSGLTGSARALLLAGGQKKPSRDSLPLRFRLTAVMPHAHFVRGPAPGTVLMKRASYMRAASGNGLAAVSAAREALSEIDRKRLRNQLDLGVYMPLRFAAALLLTLIIACGGNDGGTPETYTVRDSSGVQIVESLSPTWAEEAFWIDPEPLLRIGREEEGPYQFGFLADGLILSDGSIAIPEFRAQEIRVFDANGEHRRTFGGRGEGPGEFQNLSGVFEFPGDSLAGYDGRLLRVTIFSRSSDDFRTVQNEVAGNNSVFGRLTAGPFLLYNLGRGFRPDLPPGLQWTLTDIWAMDPDDGSFQVIARLPSREQFIEPDGNTRSIIPPRWSVQAASGEGFYWATSDRYEIGFYDGDGNLQRLQRRPIQPTAVEQSMVDDYVEANLQRVRSREGEAAVPRYRQSYEEGHFGEHVPFFGTAFVDGDRRLWVSSPIWPSLRGPPRHWSIFSQDGVWLGDLEAPEGVRILHSRGDVVLGIWQDELDVPYVQLHRLSWGH